jgi:dTDP-3-amino-2,3,6-trideoxy-4-keto-D-glucose/dTDP-3-amino-3,4,6-trideoxy-alpha-D-glucose/dTDP-2,6-dideoxy-D-kanosamine transaminase
MNEPNRTTYNFLPEQYERTNRLRINHNYLGEQFADYPDILRKIEALVLRGDFTLGEAVDRFEAHLCELTGSRHALGMGSGTDALMLSLKAAGIGRGDEVITTPYTFFATIGAIVTAGARPVFVDIREDYNLDPGLIEAAITPRTKAILPVHWSGRPCEMDAILDVAGRHGLVVVEDACHALCATYKGRMAGRFGLTGCFSLHPLKNLNAWGDGGFLLTDSDEIFERLSLMRNHGLQDRDHCAMFAYNSRLDSLQAIVADHLLQKIGHISDSREAHAKQLDELLAPVEGVTLPPRSPEVREVFHLYVIRVRDRDALQRHLVERGVDAKIHYPIPMHLQPAAREFGYQRGDFPVCEQVCDSILSLPVHEFITRADIAYMAEQIRAFYENR